MTKKYALLSRASEIAVIALCVLAGTVFLQQKSGPSREPFRRLSDTSHVNWRSFLASGSRMGPAEAPVQLIELADFECPGCRAFFLAWTAAQKRFGDSVALTYVHFPLSYHRFALRSATAAECAKEQGRFAELYAMLFRDQQLIGTKPIEVFAREALVTDSLAFRDCLARPDTHPAVRRGLALGKMLSLRGTPTILVNGLQLGSPPSERALFALIERELSGARKK